MICPMGNCKHNKSPHCNPSCGCLNFTPTDNNRSKLGRAIDKIEVRCSYPRKQMFWCYYCNTRIDIGNPHNGGCPIGTIKDYIDN